VQDAARHHNHSSLVSEGPHLHSWSCRLRAAALVIVPQGESSPSATLLFALPLQCLCQSHSSNSSTLPAFGTHQGREQTVTWEINMLQALMTLSTKCLSVMHEHMCPSQAFTHHHRCNSCICSGCHKRHTLLSVTSCALSASCYSSLSNSPKLCHLTLQQHTHVLCALCRQLGRKAAGYQAMMTHQILAGCCPSLCSVESMSPT